jgi:hypothetical protein
VALGALGLGAGGLYALRRKLVTTAGTPDRAAPGVTRPCAGDMFDMRFRTSARQSFRNYSAPEIGGHTHTGHTRGTRGHTDFCSSNAPHLKFQIKKVYRFAAAGCSAAARLRSSGSNTTSAHLFREWRATYRAARLP